jgi:hypothetical protein
VTQERPPLLLELLDPTDLVLQREDHSLAHPANVAAESADRDRGRSSRDIPTHATAG